MDAYRILQKMTFSKNINETVRRAIRVRLQVILDQEETAFKKWNENIREKLNRTRQKQIRREFEKRIQAAKIVIHWLTPYYERTDDEPTLIKRKS